MVLNNQDSTRYDLDPLKVKWCFYPGNRKKGMWDTYIVLLLLYVASVVPYRVCFVDDSSLFMIVFEYIIDASFAMDIVLTFFTAIKVKDHVIISKKTIAKLYLSGWFIIDVITTFPF